MFIATAVIAGLLALALLASGAGKLRRQAATVEQLSALGVSAPLIPWLGAIEAAGALGLVAGLFWAPIGIAAGIGVVAYFIGAVATHVRAHDRAFTPAAVLGLLGLAALVLRSTTA